MRQQQDSDLSDARPAPAAPGTVPLTDPRALRAYAHPIRLKLLGLMRLEGPLTATRAAAAIGESVASCSFHLRQMAKYGLIEAAEGGRGREKPWRAISMGMSWDSDSPDPATAEASLALDLALVRTYHDVMSDWLRSRTREPDAWRQAARFNDELLMMTAEELAALRDEISGLIEPFRRGGPAGPGHPRGARPVMMLRLAFPVDALTLGATET